MSVHDREDTELRDAIGSGEHIYHEPEDRFVVSLVVSYDPGRDASVETARDAASAALRLTTDPYGKSGTRWQVYDRATGESHGFDQEEIEVEHSHL